MKSSALLCCPLDATLAFDRSAAQTVILRAAQSLTQLCNMLLFNVVPTALEMVLVLGSFGCGCLLLTQPSLWNCY